MEWGDLLWAALTVGRPNIHAVFQHGLSSVYEAIFRLSLIRMAVEQLGPADDRFRRTDAARNLDPSEKGGVNYFLGMTLCKLFCTELLDAPWMLHLDIFRHQLNVELLGRSRPDLIGESTSHGWVTLESKGRMSRPNADTMTRAKDQAVQVIGVDEHFPAFHIAAVSYFRQDVLQFQWRDPEPSDPESGFRVRTNDDVWRYYYAPAFGLVSSQPVAARAAGGKEVAVEVDGLDLGIGIETATFQLLQEEEWGEAKRSCQQRQRQLKAEGFQPDGIRVRPGASWAEPLVDFSEGPRS